MNGPTLNLPPGVNLPGFYFIVRLSVPQDVFQVTGREFFQTIVTGILVRAIRGDLAMSGARPSCDGGVRGLPEALMAFGVEDFATGLNTVKTCLDELGLLRFASIQCHDTREDFLREYHHGSAMADPAPIFTMHDFAALQARSIKLTMVDIERMRGELGTIPPPSPPENG